MDKYKNFRSLQVEQREGIDFLIHTELRKGAKIAVVAPHGGAIEPGSSELAKAIAGTDLSFGVFQGIKASNNRDLHITSTNFDEPNCVDIVAQTLSAIAIHGEASQGEVAYLGGSHFELRESLDKVLTDNGFDVKIHKRIDLQGMSPKNICNRGISGKGVQLELSRGLRATFFENLSPLGRTQTTHMFHQFVEAVRRALVDAGMLQLKQ